MKTLKKLDRFKSKRPEDDRRRAARRSKRLYRKKMQKVTRQGRQDGLAIWWRECAPGGTAQLAVRIFAPGGWHYLRFRVPLRADSGDQSGSQDISYYQEPRDGACGNDRGGRRRSGGLERVALGACCAERADRLAVRGSSESVRRRPKRFQVAAVAVP